MKKIRLLTISATCERGGSDINLLRLLKSLDKNEYDILHLIPYTGPLVNEFKNAGIRLKIVDMPRIRLFKNPIRYIIILLKFLPTVFKIKNIIKEHYIDLVCTSSMVNLYGALAARLACRPHILLATEYLPVLRLVSPYFYLFSDKIICCSNTVSRMFKKDNRVLVRYPGIDLDEFNPDINNQNLRKRLSVKESIISMITRLDRWKGVETFIQAARYVKADTKFIVFGQLVRGKEKYLKDLENIIKKFKLEEKVSIKITRTNPEIIANSDIIVHASLRPEPFGLVIVEAMASGKPVIASRRGGPEEIISDGIDGILVEPGDPHLLAQAISRLLKNPQFSQAMGLKAREKVMEKFNLKEYVRNFNNILKETLKKYYWEKGKAFIYHDALMKISVFLAKLLVPVPSKAIDINKDMIKKILVIQFFGMGDLLCSLPLLGVLKGYFNKSKITLLIDSRLSELANLMDCKDGVIGYERSVLSKLKLLERIKNDKFDMVVILNPLFQGAWIAYFSRAKYRLGYIRDYEGLQDIGRLSRLLTHIIPTINQPMHDVERYMNITKFLGIDSPPPCRQGRDSPFSLPRLNIPDMAKIWVDNFLKNNGIKERDFILGINPNARWESRCWDMKKFAKVADTMIERYNAQVIFLGSSVTTDMRRVEIIMSLMKHKAISAAGKTNMIKLAALLKRCSIFLTNDSGPMHLAAALGVNMVALFGPGDINKFGYKRENIINLVVTDSLFCKPCLLNYQYKDNCPDNVCMKGISVEEVIKAIEILEDKR